MKLVWGKKEGFLEINYSSAFSNQTMNYDWRERKGSQIYDFQLKEQTSSLPISSNASPVSIYGQRREKGALFVQLLDSWSLF